nr:uncharacterized protein LOC124489792 [Dermatophagoides farinae]
MKFITASLLLLLLSMAMVVIMTTIVSADIEIDKTEVVLMEIVEEMIRQARQSSTDSTIISIGNKIKTLVLTSGLSNRGDLQLMIDLIRLTIDVGKNQQPNH